jgi:hypothetical protein
VPAVAAALLEVGAVAVGLLAFLAVHAHPHAGIWAALTAGFFATVVPASWVHGLWRQDRLTPAGAALAARWARASAHEEVTLVASGTVPAPVLRRLAYAVAAGVAVPVTGLPSGRSARMRPTRRRAAYRAGFSGEHAATGKPQAAWSSLTGQWRLVKIPDPGVRLGRRSARSAVARFDGQVIARWITRNGAGDETVYTPCLAIDDGSRAWSFEVASRAFYAASLGDLVSVRAAARSMKLLELTPAGQPAAGLTPGSPPGPPAAAGTGLVLGDPGGQPWLPAAGRLLTAGEVSAALGQPVSAAGITMPAAGSVVYRGSGTTVSVTVASGALGGLSSRPARFLGRPLPGIGDEAWTVNSDRTAVVRVGALTAKITISGPGFTGGRGASQYGPGRYGVVAELAATLATRLADHFPPG